MTLIEKLPLTFDVTELEKTVLELEKSCPAVMRSAAIGGWALQGISDSYADGWKFEFCPYNGPNNKGPSWNPKTEYEKSLSAIQDFRIITQINTPATQNLLRQLEASGFYPRRARIIKLKAGTSCSWHQDGNSQIYQCRLHIPIRTNKNCFFDHDQSSQHLAADGSSYLIKINCRHRVRNEGLEDRYHFVCHAWDTKKLSRDFQYDWQLFDRETDHPETVDLNKYYEIKT